MSDLRFTAFVSLSLVLALATGYSVLYNTYMDTSNPLLTHLPHPLHATHYFATKGNPLNQVFIKKAWGWTSVAFLTLFCTSPRKQRTFVRLAQYLTATAIWLVFTAWFFGPALIDRIILASGGECVLVLPTSQNDEPIMTVPHEYCLTRTRIGPETHPELFTSFAPLSIDSWKGAAPRLRRGHDVSGHVFLLTMSILFLADQLGYSLRTPVEKRTSVHRLAVYANTALLAIWYFATYVTGVYFHTPFEKLTGFLLGVGSFGIIQLPIFRARDLQRKVETTVSKSD